MLFALLLSHIPPPRIGIDSKKVKKFSTPIKWLLVLIFFFFWKVNFFGYSFFLLEFLIVMMRDECDLRFIDEEWVVFVFILIDYLI